MGLFSWIFPGKRDVVDNDHERRMLNMEGAIADLVHSVHRHRREIDALRSAGQKAMQEALAARRLATPSREPGRLPAAPPMAQQGQRGHMSGSTGGVMDPALMPVFLSGMSKTANDGPGHCRVVEDTGSSLTRDDSSSSSCSSSSDSGSSSGGGD